MQNIIKDQPELKELIGRKAWTFASFVHVAEVVKSLPPGGKVLSIGGSEGLISDRLLARRYPQLEFVGTDLELADNLPSDLPNNLRCRELDICAGPGTEEYDLVYSVECFEHIEDDALAMKNAVSFLRPGGQLLLIVPFATPEEQAHPKPLEQAVACQHKHYRIGYDQESLRRLLKPYEFAEIIIENCYWRHTGALRSYKESVFPILGSAIFQAVESLAHCDIRPGCLANSRIEAVGIKMLARGKKGCCD